MTPSLAARKRAEVDALIDTLEPHAERREVAMARQSLRGASFWLKWIEDGRVLATGETTGPKEAA